MEKDSAIGIFDSGIGGLTVMREIIRMMPYENIVYFGDTARIPYGNKSAKTILHYSIENVSFLIEQNIKLLIIACHTSCSHALESLQSYFPIPIIGVVTPGYENLMRVTRNQKVAILGTTSTISSGIYQKLIIKNYPHATVHPIACPLFVPLIEEGYSEHTMIKLAAKEYLSSLKDTSIDSLLLACTHYPLITSVLKKLLPTDVTIVDPSTECASHATEYLEKNALFNNSNAVGSYQFFVSDAPEKFKKMAEQFLKIPTVEVMYKSMPVF